jgi:peptidyl-tRNA hydrolase, PTH1 family
VAGEWLVVGLGNPGPDYARTRHNIGQMVVDLMAERLRARFGSHKARAEIAQASLGIGSDVPRLILARPRSYMNESGGPVSALQKFFKIPNDHLIVIHDDLDLPLGSLRAKSGGGDGGHNGLKSITSAIGPDYLRIRLGIGRPPGRQDPADFVLKPFASAERSEVELLMDSGADAVESLVTVGLEITQQKFNA